ncbi:glycosyltransferase involved in cell wall biosynthesis [Neolewinella xylanilytica]|uniref:Glycosyltransferase involved in cell wall biosynthesis n=1 Tax=Neolewinella xylanilytica TaxID=1514080 RepID=A0A2S6I908_9BACT|nr:glycosyltransferase family 4 protein [Neolewinella xylanilytica]PPK87968.1 glycosyltransferase involved in cell wall biosynthesis [Neolewinella xylanilytica]
MKKVLFVLDTLKTGGAEKSTLYIASRLKNVDATVCTIYRGDDLSGDPAFTGVKIIRLDAPDGFNFFANAKKLRAVIDKVQPDLVVSSIFKANIVTRLSLRGTDIPLLGTFINDDYPWGRFQAGDFKNKAFFIWRYLWDVVTVRRNTHMVSNSEAIKSSNAGKLLYPRSRVSVIYRGRPIEEEKQGDRTPPVSTAPGKLRFLNVGRLIERKGQLELIRAFQRALHTYPNLQLLIAGEGSFRSVLERAICEGERGDSIRLLGHVSNVDELLESSQVFVLASHFEGFSGALVEGMLAGKLIICSDIPMNTEAIRDGENGLVFRCRDEDDLYSKIVQAVAEYEELRRLGDNARAYAVANYDMEKAAEQYEALYLNLMRP